MGDYAYEDYSYSTENNQKEGNEKDSNEAKDSEHITISTKQMKKAHCSITVQNVLSLLVLVAMNISVAYITIGKLPLDKNFISVLIIALFVCLSVCPPLNTGFSLFQTFCPLVTLLKIYCL